MGTQPQLQARPSLRKLADPGLTPSSAPAALTAAPKCPACSGHSPDLRWIRQGLRAPLVPRCPAQTAGGAGIPRHQKQAPVGTVTVHTCGAHETQQHPLSPGTWLPGSLAAPNHMGPPSPPRSLATTHRCVHTYTACTRTCAHTKHRTCTSTQAQHTHTPARTFICGNVTSADMKQGWRQSH